MSSWNSSLVNDVKPKLMYVFRAASMSYYFEYKITVTKVI